MSVVDEFGSEQLKKIDALLAQNARDRERLLRWKGLIESGFEDERGTMDDAENVWTGSATELYVSIIRDLGPMRVRQIVDEARKRGLTLDSKTATNAVDGTIRPLTKGKNPRLKLVERGLFAVV